MTEGFDDYEDESGPYRGLSFWTPSEILHTPLPEWYIDGLLQHETLTVIFGESGSGKSFLALDLAFHLALERSWFGRRTERAGVLYIAAEASKGIAARFKAFHQHHALTDEEYLPLFISPERLDLLADDALDVLMATYQETTTTSVVVIDTLSRCTPGGDEGTADMSRAVGVIDDFREATGATVIVVHHSPIANKDRPRGHSSLPNAADGLIKVETVGRICQATLSYHREGEDGIALSFRLQQVQVGLNKHGEPVTSCVVAPIESATSKPKQQRLKPATKDFFDSLVAIADLAQQGVVEGARAPGDRGTSWNCPLDRVRQEFFARQADLGDTKGDKAEAGYQRIKKRFQRALKDAQDLGIAGFRDDLVWRVYRSDGPEGTAGT